MEDPAAKPVVKQAAKAAEQLANSSKSVEQSSKAVEKSSEQIERTAGAVKESTRKVERSTKEVMRDTNRQVQLAADRTLLAMERTYAAWVRTALASLASGVGARALLEGHVPLILAKLTGSVLVLFAGFCLVAAVWRELWGPVPPPTTDLKPVPRLLLAPVNAFLLLVALAALIGIWAA